MRGHLSKALLACCLALLSLACSEEKGELTKTQVTLRLQPRGTSLTSMISLVRLRVYRAVAEGWSLTSQENVDSTRLRWPLDIPILPPSSGMIPTQFEVLVDAYAGPTWLAQARTISNFAAGSARVLELELFACEGEDGSGRCIPDACHGPACTQCGPSGGCEQVRVADAQRLPPYDPSSIPEAIASGTGLDASTDAAAAVDAAELRDVAQPGDTAPPATPGCDAGCDAGEAGAVAPLTCGSCPAAQRYCDPGTQRCVECTDDMHCPAEKHHCEQNACVVCAKNEHCTASTAPYCVQNRCVACRGPADCPIATNRCVSGACTSACASSSECPQQASCDPVMQVCTCSSIGLVCDGSMLVERDSCGKTLFVKSGCCGRGCTGNACNPPNPRAAMGCDHGNLYYLDSCGVPTELIQTCCGKLCADTACVPPYEKDHKVCYNDDSYYEDTCGKRGALAQSCCGRGCGAGGECVAPDPHASMTCVNGDSYWVDSCGKQTPRTGCAGLGCVNGLCNSGSD